MLHCIARRAIFCAVILILSVAVFAQSAPRIAILGALPPLTEATDAENAAILLKRDGFAPQIVTPEQLADPKFFNSARFAALVVPHSSLFPAVAQSNLLSYLRGQGKLLCVGGPAFERYVYCEEGAWKLRERLTKPPNPALAAIKQPNLPTLSPPDQVFHVGSEIAGAWLPVARERGMGFSGNRPGRLLPADPRGTETEYSPEVRKRQWGYLCLSGPMRGAVWGTNPKINAPNEPTFTSLSAILKRILGGVYLVKAGAEFASYVIGQPAVIGAEFINFSSARKIAAEIEIRGFGESSFQKFIAYPAETLAPGIPSGYSETLRDLPPGAYIVRVTLFDENGAKEEKRPVLDRLTAPFRVLPALNLNQKSPVSLGKGRKGFIKNGKPFNPKTQNFEPLWTNRGDGAERGQDWLAPEQYDSELIAADLADLTARAKENINVLRIGYRSLNETPALRDFLTQCSNRNLLVDIVILETDAQKAAVLVAAAQLPRHPAVFGIEVSEEMKAGRTKFIQNQRRLGLLIGDGASNFSERIRTLILPFSKSLGWDFVTFSVK